MEVGMPARTLCFALSFGLFTWLASLAQATASGQDPLKSGPELVSPVAPRGETRVGSACPTFSWTPVQGATGYEIVVYEVPAGGTPRKPEDRPLLRRALPQGALAWMPTLDECLPGAGRYGWAVGALIDGGGVEWSRPGLFRVLDPAAGRGPANGGMSQHRKPTADAETPRGGVAAATPSASTLGSLPTPSVFTPPECGVAPFSDVPASSPYCPFVRQAFGAGITSGCGGGKYCPQGAVTREQLAMFLTRVLRAHGVRDLDSGGSHTCAILAGGRVACWGYNGTGQIAAPGGVFTAISAGASHTCGIRMDGSVECWGGNVSGESSPPAEVFTSVSAGGMHTCGLLRDDTVACWGSNSRGQTSSPAAVFKSLSAGGLHTCGIFQDDTLTCWGYDDQGQATPPPGTFSSVSAGAFHTCGVRTDGELACWGHNGAGEASPPAGTFVSVSAGNPPGDSHTCGVKTDGTIACWGLDTSGQAPSPAPPGIFVSVSAGGIHTCGVEASGLVACWGSNNVGQTASPPWL
jgi:hypothetical protein